MASDNVIQVFSGISDGFRANALLKNPNESNGAQAAYVNWIRNLALEILTIFIARNWNGNLLASLPTWRPREVVDTDGQIRLDRRQRLIRWDRRGPNEIFRDGFIPHVTSEDPTLEETNLFLYARSNIKSFFVSTTKTQRNRRNYVWTPRSANSGTIYQYEIYAPGGIDVNDSLQETSPWPNQLEVAFPGGIRYEFIRSAREMRDGIVQRVWINPRFIDPGELTPIATRSTTPQILWRENYPDGKNLRRSLLQTNSNHDIDQDMNGSSGEFVEDKFENEEHNRSIPDGEYKIASSINHNVVADLSGGHLSSVHTWQNLGVNNQKWNFIYDNDKKAFRITSTQDSNLVLTWMLQDDRAVGYNFVDYDTQFWKIKRTEDGYYKLQNLHDTSKVLDLAGGSTTNGSRIQLIGDTTNPNYMPNQKWIISPISYRTVPNGEYKVASILNQNVVTDLSGGHLSSVHAWQYLGVNKQKWNFIYDINRKAYKITSSQDSNLVLTWMLQDNRAVGYNFVDYDTQYWRIEMTADGYCKFRNLHDPSTVLDLNRGDTSNGSRIQLVKDNTNPNYVPNKKWKISIISYQTVQNGEFKISSSINQNVVADLSDGHLSSVHAWQYLGAENQKWNLIYDNNRKAYRINSCRNSNLVLTWMLQDDRAVGYNFVDYDTQYWRIERTEDGYYKLRNLHDPSRVLDLAGGSTSNRSRIQLAADSTNRNYMPNQKWALTQINAAIVPNGEYQISSRINHTKVVDYDSSNYNLMISDNLTLDTSYWWLEYDTSKKAYKIYTKKILNMGLFFQNSNFNVKVDNIDGPDSENLRPYWTIEYNASRGGYLIRSLQNPTQALDLESSKVIHGTSILSYSVNNNNNQLWYVIPR